ncbi:MAG: NYN domain-containing protein, partial [Deltaproteobacteria bacterium]|nr:NYN domain-containing protein [Deltaproteobacteria bacterium]
MRRLDSYKKVKHHPVTIVFDGTHADHSMEARTRWKGIHVLFSRRGESADAVIKRIVTRERERIVVVTSDREVADFASEHGAATMDSISRHVSGRLCGGSRRRMDTYNEKEGSSAPHIQATTKEPLQDKKALTEIINP